MDRSFSLIGIGGAGCAIANHVHAVLGGCLVHINACDDIAEERADVTCIALPTRPRGYRNDPDVCQCVEGARDELIGLLSVPGPVFLFAGLGGAIGSGAAPAVARLAAELGIDVAGMVTLPFAYETRGVAVAEKAIALLRLACSPLFVHDHDNASRAAANANLSMHQLLALASSAAVAHVREHIGVVT